VSGTSTLATTTVTLFTATGQSTLATASSTGLTVTTDTFLATASGNVGVGITSPNAKFQVLGQAMVGGTGNFGSPRDMLTFNTVGTNYAHIFDPAISGTNKIAIGGTGTVGSVPSVPIMTWDLAGNGVAFGTTTGSGKLSIQAAFGNTTPLFDIATTTSAAFATSSLFTVLANGNVGIGTSTPGSKLSVQGDAYIGGNLTATGTLNVTGQTTLTTASSTGLTTTGSTFLATAGGSVGIGTTTPLTTLHISSPNAEVARFTSTAGATIAEWIALTQGSTVKTYLGNEGSGGGLGTGTLANATILRSSNDIQLVTSNGSTIATTFLANGNVGIGLANPATKLQVGGTGGFTDGISVVRSTTVDSGLYFYNDANNNYIDSNFVSTGAVKPLRIRVGTNEVFSANTSGNVAIGTTTASAHLSILQAFGATTPLFDVSTTTSAGFATSSLFTVLANGNVGIGTSTPIASLAIKGTGGTNPFTIASSTGATLFSVLQSGALVLGTSTYAGSAGEVYANFFTAASTTATSSFAGNLSVGSGAILYDASTTVTSISNLEFGNLAFDYDAGIVQWMDLPILNAATGTVESYSAAIGGTPVITVYGESTGSSASKNLRLGIGTTTPTTTLFVQGSSTDNPLTIASSTGSSLFTILANGNVGIGSSTPGFAFVVSGATTSVRNLIPEANLTYTLGASSTRWLEGWFNTLNIGSSSWSIGQSAVNSRFSIFDASNKAGNERFTITTAGNTGIGTSTPGSLLTIASSTGAGTSGLFEVGTSSTNIFKVLANGNVGIGTSTPTQLFTIGNTSPFMVNDAGAITAQSATIGSTSISPVIVTGTISPNFNGTYTYAGQFAGKNYYQLPGGTAFIWWRNCCTQWFVSASLGDTVGSFVNSAALTPPAGTYTANGVSGAAVVSFPALSYLNIDGSGNLTGGSGTFTGALSVTGQSTLTASLSVASSTATADTSIFSVGTTTNFLFATAYGRLGIGNSTPNDALEVASGNIFINGTTGNGLKVGGNNGIFMRGNVNELAIDTNSSERIRITGGGNVGIGTTTPGYKLDVNGTIATRESTFGNGILMSTTNSGGSPVLNFTRTDNAGVVTIDTPTSFFFGKSIAVQGDVLVGAGGGLGVNGTGALPIFSSGANPITFSTNSGERMRIDSAGNVGIGTTTPGSLLQVAGTSTLGVASTTSGILSFLNSANGFSTSLRASTTLTANLMFTLPGTLGSSGNVLTSDGAGGMYWAAGGGLSGGQAGFIPRWLTASTLGTSTLIDNGTVAGVNATSSSYSFLVQGAPAVHPFAVASSSGATLFQVQSNGTVVVGAGDGGTPIATTIRGAAAGVANTNGANLTFDASTGLGTGTSGAIIFRSGNSGATPLALDATSTQTLAGAATTTSWSHTVTTSGTNRILIVAAHINFRNSSLVSSITYGGQSLTKLAAVQNGTADDDEIWYLLNPPTGTNTVIATTTPGLLASTGAVFSATSFVGVNQSIPFGTVATSTGSGTALTVSPPSAAGDIVIGFASRDATTLTLSQSGTLTQLYPSTAVGTTVGRITGIGSMVTATTTTTTLGWTATVTGNWATIGVALKTGVTGSEAGTLSERLRVDSTGNIGIGTSTPNTLLTVASSTATGLNTLFSVATSTSLFNVFANGSVSLGTSSPSNQFVVAASTTSGTIAEVHNSSTSGWSGTSGGLLVLQDDSSQSAVGAYVFNIKHNNTTEFAVDFTGGVFAAPNNNPAFPNYTFTSDQNVGMYHPGTDILGFSTNGLERLRMDASGNIGIGTSTTANAFVTIASSTMSGTNVLLAVGSTTNSIFNVLANGNVGIGSSTPNYSLSVQGTGTTHPFAVASSSGSTLFQILATGDAVLGAGEGGTPTAVTLRGPAASGSNISGANLTIDASNGTGTGSSGDIIFRTASQGTYGPVSLDATSTFATSSTSASSFSWTHTISTTGGSRLLVVKMAYPNGAGQSITSVQFGGLQMIRKGIIGGASNTADMWYLLNPPTGTHTILVTNNGLFSSNAFHAASESYIGVNQSVPFGTVASAQGATVTTTVTVTTVSGDLVTALATKDTSTALFTKSTGITLTYATTTPFLQSQGGNMTATTTSAVMTWTSTSTAQWDILAVPIKTDTLVTATQANTLSDRLHITAGGNVGIGTSTPFVALQVIGDIRVGTSSSGGCLQGYSGATLAGTCTSDERLKDNVKDVGSVLDRFAGLRVINYNWNQTASSLYHDDMLTLQTGYLAQNVESLFPELVSVNADGFKQVNYSAMSFYTAEAVKELAVQSKTENQSVTMFQADEAVDYGTIVAFSTSTHSYVDTTGSSTYSIAGIRKATLPGEAIGIVTTKSASTTVATTTVTTQNAVPVAFTGKLAVRLAPDSGDVEAGQYVTVSTSSPGTATKMTSAGRSIGIALSSAPSGGTVMVLVSLGYENVDTTGRYATTTAMLTTGNLDLNANGVAIINIKSLASASGAWSIDADGRITAKVLCLEDVCIDKTQLTNILQFHRSDRHRSGNKYGCWRSSSCEYSNYCFNYRKRNFRRQLQLKKLQLRQKLLQIARRETLLQLQLLNPAPTQEPVTEAPPAEPVAQPDPATP
jgi:fibronectin-binding autotransporter adhesin